MKPIERDELLIRLDERTANIYHLTEKQEQHLSDLNDSIARHGKQIVSNSTNIKWITRILTASGITGGMATIAGKILGWF